jgi:hypothetical protein
LPKNLNFSFAQLASNRNKLSARHAGVDAYNAPIDFLAARSATAPTLVEMLQNQPA